MFSYASYSIFHLFITCLVCMLFCLVFFFKQKTAYEMRISDWSSDVCSSDPPTPYPSPTVAARAAPSAAPNLAALPESDVPEAPAPKPAVAASRSEERRVGKECVRTCRSRWSPYH